MFSKIIPLFQHPPRSDRNSVEFAKLPFCLYLFHIFQSFQFLNLNFLTDPIIIHTHESDLKVFVFLFLSALILCFEVKVTFSKVYIFFALKIQSFLEMQSFSMLLRQLCKSDGFMQFFFTQIIHIFILLSALGFNCSVCQVLQTLSAEAFAVLKDDASFVTLMMMVAEHSLFDVTLQHPTTFNNKSNFKSKFNFKSFLTISGSTSLTGKFRESKHLL